MNKVANVTVKNGALSQNISAQTAYPQTVKKQSKFSRLLAYLANLETGFPLSGA